MLTLDTLIKAINNKQAIGYRYHKEGEEGEMRWGHPYAIYILTTKAGIKSTKVHIVQIRGFSDSGKPFPSFRQHNIEDIRFLELIEEFFDEPFHRDYKPHSDMYIDIIAKV